MYGTNNRSPADAEVIDVLIAISNVSARLARKLTILAAQSKSEYYHAWEHLFSGLRAPCDRCILTLESTHYI